MSEQLNEDMEQIKKGDTLDVSGPVAMFELDGQVQDLTGWGVRGQVRRPDGVFVCHLDCTWLDARQRLLRVRANTSAWPLGVVAMDVEFESPAGDVITSPTMHLFVTAKVTRRKAALRA